MRKKYSSEFKTKVVIEALKELQPLSEVAIKHELQRTMLSNWRQQALDHLNNMFKDKSDRVDKKVLEQEELINELYKQIGQLKVENEWLKKKSDRFRCL